MILNDSTGELVALMPLAKWLSKRFNLPLKRNDKPPKQTEAKHKKINGIHETPQSTLGHEKIKKIPKVKKEGTLEVEAKSSEFNTAGENTEDIDDVSFYTKVEALKKRATANKAFVSTDANENADITDAAWDQLKALKNDNERMNHAIQKFGNQKHGEPNRNMSVHGHRRCRLAKTDEKCRNAREENKANKMFFEFRRQNLLQIKDGRIETIYSDQNQMDPHTNKRKAGEHEDMPRAKKPKLVTIKDYEAKMIEALVKFKKPKLAPLKDQKNTLIINKYWRYYLRHFKNSMEETMAVFKYYSEYKDADNNVLMTRDELDANICMEKIFYVFTGTYGQNPVTRCKDCEEVDKTMGKEINHPY